MNNSIDLSTRLEIPKALGFCRRKDSPLRKMKYALGVIFVALAGNSLCHAQVDRSGLGGTITDAEGRVLPKTHITVVQNSTQLTRETVSQSNGSYNLPQLPVGVYTISFEHAGFKRLTYLDVEEVILLPPTFSYHFYIRVS